MQPGETFDTKFLILDRLGEGGMGVVYKVSHINLDEVYALKVVRSEVLTDKAAARRLKNEAQLAGQLVHRNIVRVYSSGFCNETPYVLMEYLIGYSLSDLLKQKGSLSIEELFPIVEQCCAALRHAHEHGIVHLDLKPGNIWLQDGVVKLLDFGIARAIDQNDSQKLALTGVLVGSPAYMSPEQCKGKTPGAASDIYSLGCVAYECLTGVPPFQGEVMSSVLLRHLNESPQSPSKLNAALAPFDDIILRMLAKEPLNRPTLEQITQALNPAAQEVQQELQRHKEIGVKKARRLQRLIAAALSIVIISCGGMLFMRTEYSVPAWEFLNESPMISKSLKPAIINQLGVFYDQKKMPGRKFALCSKALIEALSEPHLNYNQVRQPAFQMIKLERDNKWSPLTLGALETELAKREKAGANDDAADLLEIITLGRLENDSTLTSTTFREALRVFELRSKKSAGERTKKFVQTIEQSLAKSPNQSNTLVARAQLLLAIFRLTEHNMAVSGLSAEDLISRITDVMIDLSKTHNDNRTDELCELLMAAMTEFLHKPPQNWQKEMCLLYDSTTAKPMMVRVLDTIKDKKRRTYGLYLLGEMARARGRKKEAAQYYLEAQEEFHIMGKGLMDIAGEVPFIRQLLLERLKETTSP